MKKDSKARRMNSGDGADDISTPPILGDDAVSDILSRLPVKSLMRFKCVCKSWLSLIQSDPHFADLQFTQSKKRPVFLISTTQHAERGTNFYSMDLSEGTNHGAAALASYTITTSWTQPILKPVNGLICFVDYNEDAVLIFNLSTRKETPWIKRNKEEEMSLSMYDAPSYGFGFDPATKEHKVICVWTKFTNETTLPADPTYQVCEVLTVGQNSWRRIAEVPPYSTRGDPFYSNGALYWLSYIIDSNPTTEFIVKFDVGSEKFRVIPVPDFNLDPPLSISGPLRHGVHDLIEVDERLALLHRKWCVEDKITIKVWIFDDDDDDNKEKKSTTTSTSSSNWIEESSFSMSYNPKQGWPCSFQPIAGTDVIILKKSTPDPMDRTVSIHFYNRKKKTSIAHHYDKAIVNPKDNLCHRIHYTFSIFVESLFHV